MKWWLVCMRNYVNFRGRARRREFWWFMVVNTLLVCLSYGATVGFGWMAYQYRSWGWMIVAIVFLLLAIVSIYGTLLPGIAVRARRLHDIGWSSKWLIAYYALHVLCMYAMFNNIFEVELELINNEVTWDSPRGLFLAAWASMRPLVFALAALNLLGLLVMCIDSEPGENKYGPNSKAVTPSEHPEN